LNSSINAYLLKLSNKKFVQPRYNKSNFIEKIAKNGLVLDVGCGNNSPYHTKKQRPDLYYVGIDIGDYNQVSPNTADEYIITAPDSFSDVIAGLGERFDAVISSHNLEHCNFREKTLEAITSVLRPGGSLYLSFPTEKSVSFKGGRVGCLNYYDDSSHKGEPPGFSDVIKTLKRDKMKISFARKSYKPFYLFLIGFLFERKSKHEKETYPGTWAYWGFETVIWAEKQR